MLLARRALMSRNIRWLLTRLENHFRSNQICFYPNLGKVFQLPEFQAKLFLSEIEWVVLRETASKTLNLLHVSSCEMFTFCDVLHETKQKKT